MKWRGTIPWFYPSQRIMFEKKKQSRSRGCRGFGQTKFYCWTRFPRQSWQNPTMTNPITLKHNYRLERSWWVAFISWIFKFKLDVLVVTLIILLEWMWWTPTWIQSNSLPALIDYFWFNGFDSPYEFAVAGGSLASCIKSTKERNIIWLVLDTEINNQQCL